MVSKKDYDCFNLVWFFSSLPPRSSNHLALGCVVILCWQYYIRRGTCKFGYKFHHLKQGGSSVALQIWHENLGYGMTLRDEIDGCCDGVGSLKAHRQRNYILACRLYGSSGCGEEGKYETLTLNCLLFVMLHSRNHNVSQDVKPTPPVSISTLDMWFVSICDLKTYEVTKGLVFAVI
ncbi:unnamed protein product [Prunus armeniaca]|uniref:Uncharacterized protein n=1 Tax=Prunus armeniaca TaxID=36596 RepID=A0A6J5VQZ1_PRUAR|nr:unnamed protein product [Prunus armeniaca]